LRRPFKVYTEEEESTYAKAGSTVTAPPDTHKKAEG
jgi:hypothetical protein